MFKFREPQFAASRSPQAFLYEFSYFNRKKQISSLLICFKKSNSFQRNAEQYLTGGGADRRRPVRSSAVRAAGARLFSASQLSESESASQSLRPRSAADGSVQFSEIPSRGGFNVQDQGEVLENLEDTKGYSVKEWVVMESPRLEIVKRFKKFLITFTKPKSTEVYFLNMIKQMIRRNECSVEIDYNYLASREHVLAFFLPEAPKEMISILDSVIVEWYLLTGLQINSITNLDLFFTWKKQF